PLASRALDQPLSTLAPPRRRPLLLQSQPWSRSPPPPSSSISYPSNDDASASGGPSALCTHPWECQASGSRVAEKYNSSSRDSIRITSSEPIRLDPRSVSL